MINGSPLSWKPETSEVPQGTVLGPQLFLLYIPTSPKAYTQRFAYSQTIAFFIDKLLTTLIHADNLQQGISRQVEQKPTMRNRVEGFRRIKYSNSRTKTWINWLSPVIDKHDGHQPGKLLSALRSATSLAFHVIVSNLSFLTKSDPISSLLWTRILISALASPQTYDGTPEPPEPWTSSGATFTDALLTQTRWLIPPW
jgi:hypothetical protein